jgi:hypothetical protein
MLGKSIACINANAIAVLMVPVLFISLFVILAAGAMGPSFLQFLEFEFAEKSRLKEIS